MSVTLGTSLMLVWPRCFNHSHVKVGDVNLLTGSSSQTPARLLAGQFERNISSQLLCAQTFTVTIVQLQLEKQRGEIPVQSSVNPNLAKTTEVKNL